MDSNKIGSLLAGFSVAKSEKTQISNANKILDIEGNVEKSKNFYLPKMSLLRNFNPSLLSLCNLSSSWIYENLTKILRVGKDGGNTCFGLTMRLHKELVELGYSPKLLLGHKRHIKNAHCALSIIDNGTELFLDPGYLIFDPLPIPANIPRLNKSTFPLQPNWVRLEREGENLCLWTGTANEAAKFRFYFPLKGCSMQEFNLAWEQSYTGESMKYPVFNKLDKRNGIQYYYQNGKLLTRTASGATQQRIESKDRVEVLSSIFGLDRELLSTPFLF